MSLPPSDVRQLSEELGFPLAPDIQLSENQRSDTPPRRRKKHGWLAKQLSRASEEGTSPSVSSRRRNSSPTIASFSSGAERVKSDGILCQVETLVDQCMGGEDPLDMRHALETAYTMLVDCTEEQGSPMQVLKSLPTLFGAADSDEKQSRGHQEIEKAETVLRLTTWWEATKSVRPTDLRCVKIHMMALSRKPKQPPNVRACGYIEQLIYCRTLELTVMRTLVAIRDALRMPPNQYEFRLAEKRAKDLGAKEEELLREVIASLKLVVNECKTQAATEMAEEGEALLHALKHVIKQVWASEQVEDQRRSDLSAMTPDKLSWSQRPPSASVDSPIVQQPRTPKSRGRTPRQEESDVRRKKFDDWL